VVRRLLSAAGEPDAARHRTAALSAEIADIVRRVQQVVSTEVTDCPRLFTLAPARQVRIGKARIHQRRFRPALWCEHPGQWHPWEQAEYDLDLPADWFAQAARYMRLVLRTLQLAVPLAGAIAVAALPQDQQGGLQARLDVANLLLADLPAETGRSTAVSSPARATGQLTRRDAPRSGALR
jgi:hypothetical protein